MNPVTAVEVCANCGALLELDQAGRCRWCHARLRRAPEPGSAAGFRVLDQVRLVPEGTDLCDTSAPFLYLALTSVELLGSQPAVREYMSQEPWLLAQIRTLVTAVSEAGARVRDEGLLRSSFDESLGVYTPEEIWTFDLLFDVLAWLGTLDSLTRQDQARTASNIQSLDLSARHHHWKKALKKAGAGPVAGHELRTRIPHRA